MSFLAPEFFFASLAVAAGVVALHFIVTRQPRAGILPTARFVPDMPASATARAARPYDLLLMLLRVLLVLAVGAGLARPVIRPTRKAVARVILVDVSRSVSDSIAMRDSLRSLYRENDAVMAFDSAARFVGGSVADSIGSLQITDRRGNISAALIAALRAASSLRDRADSMELVMISPVAAEEIDAATDDIRGLWPGSLRLARLASVRDSAAVGTGKLDVAGSPAGPLRISATLASRIPGSIAIIVREGNGEQELQAATRPLLIWPSSSRPPFAIAREKSDTIGGVVAASATVVAPFNRRWTYPADSVKKAEVIARWIDGEPAAIEKQQGGSCVRSSAIPVSPAGDLVLRQDFVRFVAQLSGECIARSALLHADPATVIMLRGSGGFASRDAFLPRGDTRSDLAPWLIGLALVAAFAELLVRRQKNQSLESASSIRKSREARAA